MKPTPKEPAAAFSFRLDAHHRFACSCVVAAIAFLIAGHLFTALRLLITWDMFALTTVLLAGLILFTRDPYEVRRNVRLQDSSATFLFTLVISAATVSLVAVGVLLGLSKTLSKAQLAGEVSVSVAAIGFSWMLVHTLFALRYAHLYYFNAQEKERSDASGGLVFPGGETPDYIDFAYFSFVIGMTCQVSDVQISAQPMRRLALVHGLISFCFNTAILAMFVNIVASLL